MKKKILLLLPALVFLSMMLTAEDYWVDVNFTRDSTMWIEAFPPLAANGLNTQCTPDPAVKALGHKFDAAFGKFAVSNYSYAPLNVEDTTKQFIYAIRLHNNDLSYWALPGTSDVGTIKINAICGNATGEAEINLQKYVSGEGTEAIWKDFDPVVKFAVPPHAFSTKSFVVEKTLNLSGSPKLRFKGPTLKNVHIFAVTISKNENAGINDKMMSKITMDLNGRSLKLKTDVLEYNATVFDLAGWQLGTLKKDETFTFASAGVYLVRVATAEGTFAKKIAVF